MPDPITVLSAAKLASQVGGAFFRSGDLRKFQEQFRKDQAKNNAVNALSRGRINLEPTRMAPKESFGTQIFSALGQAADIGSTFYSLKGMADQNKLRGLQLEGAERQAGMAEGAARFAEMQTEFGDSLENVDPSAFKHLTEGFTPDQIAGFQQSAQARAQQDLTNSMAERRIAAQEMQATNSGISANAALTSAQGRVLSEQNQAKAYELKELKAQADAANDLIKDRTTAEREAISNLQNARHPISGLMQNLALAEQKFGAAISMVQQMFERNDQIVLNAEFDENGEIKLNATEQNALLLLFQNGFLEPGLAVRTDDRRALEEGTRGLWEKFQDLFTKSAEGLVLNKETQQEFLSAMSGMYDSLHEITKARIDSYLGDPALIPGHEFFDSGSINTIRTGIGARHLYDSEIRPSVRDGGEALQYFLSGKTPPPNTPGPGAKKLGDNENAKLEALKNIQPAIPAGKFAPPSNGIQIDVPKTGPEPLRDIDTGAFRPSSNVSAFQGINRPLGQFGMPQPNEFNARATDSAAEFQALQRDIRAKISAKNNLGITADSTLADFAKVWAPQNPTFAQDLSKLMGIDPSMKMRFFNQGAELDALTQSILQLGKNVTTNQLRPF